MTIQRSPHPVFSVLWVLWYGSVLAALSLPNEPLVGLIVLLVFLPIEAVGVFVDTGSRDTLSEIATWVQRKLSKHRALRGWNLLLLMVIMSIAYLLGRTAMDYSGSVLLAGVFFVCTTGWLYDHWVSPDVHG